ncbi:MAG: NADH-quinone oxidoreductase subunit NuoE [Bdellovibrionaceae bacterium]|nr:NADH-quinone oxidoreductase subunit NuoE [Pseudobdellovibrionaceae bacterium]MDW8189629.1 NADH-quinone oxidoreductase subunit NuoE [Pseudobdellovibrionaceae bacterium]
MFALSPEGLERVKKEMRRYETKQSAIIPALYIAQQENNGWISDEVIDYLSRVMEIPAAQINEVFKFYTMFNQKPVGRYHVQVCGTLSCHVNGAPELIEFLCRHLGVKLDEMTADGKFTISRVECLGSCGTAPMMQVNDTYYENLTPEKALQILKNLP